MIRHISRLKRQNSDPELSSSKLPFIFVHILGQAQGKDCTKWGPGLNGGRSMVPGMGTGGPLGLRQDRICTLSPAGHVQKKTDFLGPCLP